MSIRYGLFIELQIEGLDAVTAQAREMVISIVQPMDISGKFFFQKLTKIKLTSYVACFFRIFFVLTCFWSDK